MTIFDLASKIDADIRLFAWTADATEIGGVVDVGVAAEADGTLRHQVILRDPVTNVQVAAAADESGSEKGALHVKLKSVSGPAASTPNYLALITERLDLLIELLASR